MYLNTYYNGVELHRGDKIIYQCCLINNQKAQHSQLYHLGMKPTSRATLARVDEQQPASLYETLFLKLLEKCQQVAPGHKFSFKSKLYLLDTTTIDLCLFVFPWAKFRKRKGAIRLYMILLRSFCGEMYKTALSIHIFRTPVTQ